MTTAPPPPISPLTRNRLIAAVVAPMLVLMAFGGYVVAGKLETYRRSADLLDSAGIARSTSGLAREIQRERALSALFIGAGRVAWGEALHDQRQATERAADEVRLLIVRPQTIALLGGWRPYIGFDQLEPLRALVDGKGDVKDVLYRYNHLIAETVSASSRLRSGGEGNLIAAFTDLGNLKDRLGQVRSLGAAWLLQRPRDPNLLPPLIEAHAEAEAFIEAFRTHSSPEQIAAFYGEVDAGLLDAADAQFSRAMYDRLGQADADEWQRSYGHLIDAISRAEDLLASAMERDIRRQLVGAQIAFYTVAVVVLCLVAFALFTLRRSELRAVLAEEQARKLFRAVEQSPISVVITNPAAVIEYVNPAFSASTGYGQEEAIGQTPRLLKSDQMAPGFYAAMWQTIRDGQDWRGEVCNRRKDGRLYWESMTIAPVRGADGRVVNFIALKEDITEVKSLRQALENEHAKIQRILESLRDGIALIGPDGRFEYTNPALIAEFGEADGCDYADYPAGETIPGADQREWRSHRTARTYEITRTPVNNAEGGVETLHVFHDITLRKQAEEAMQAAREAAEMANRAKSEFLAAMSHELRTPLNAIIGFSEIMASELLGPLGQAQYQDYASDIHSSGRHLLQLINDVLDVARLEVGTVALNEEEVQVAHAVAGALAMVRERAQVAGVSLNTDIGADLPRLWGDSRRLKQVLFNIIGNAVKFTPAGGKVTISGRLSEDGDLLIGVSDTGIGIAAEDMAKVMAPFGQADSGMARRYEGSGLGLPLARKLMDLHNGGLALDSEPGRGTTVSLRFPKERLRNSAG